MKKKTLGLLFTIIIFNPLSVLADSQYPASDFQPTVIFADESAKSNSTSAFDAEFPAANFQPKVLFIAASAKKISGETSSFDPAYPAANFEPKTIYP
jgi:hypothetical protein